MYDDKEGVIPGNALVVDPKRYDINYLASKFITFSYLIVIPLFDSDNSGLYLSTAMRSLTAFNVQLLHRQYYQRYLLLTHQVFFLEKSKGSTEVTTSLVCWNGLQNESTGLFFSSMHISWTFLMNLDDQLKHLEDMTIRLESYSTRLIWLIISN